ncbi:hypothetical protein F5890DRAFT_1567216 [Lentinula detonsa]|uniref:Uncharacterized protein n=1 Tax=Lentinula detonsa TaxID=2804962 RepID=A0AA38USI3_9AGAR|nr:hypothetical protein F5890DRAFT_1567216 [Lentinula detonsa]
MFARSSLLTQVELYLSITSYAESMDEDHPRLRIDINALNRFLTHAGALPRRPITSNDVDVISSSTPRKETGNLDKALQLMQKIYEIHLQVEHIQKDLTRSGHRDSIDNTDSHADEMESRARSQRTLQTEYTDKKQLLNDVIQQFTSIEFARTPGISYPFLPSALPNSPKLPYLTSMPPEITLSEIRLLPMRLDELKHSLMEFKESPKFTTAYSDIDITSPCRTDCATLLRAADASASGPFQGPPSPMSNYDHLVSGKWPAHFGVYAEDHPYEMETLCVQLKSVKSRLRLISEKQRMFKELSTLSECLAVTPLQTVGVGSVRMNTVVLAQEALVAYVQELVKRLNSQDFAYVETHAKESEGSQSSLASILDFEVKKTLVGTLVKKKLHAIALYKRLKNNDDLRILKDSLI